MLNYTRNSFFIFFFYNKINDKNRKSLRTIKGLKSLETNGSFVFFHRNEKQRYSPPLLFKSSG